VWLTRIVIFSHWLAPTPVKLRLKGIAVVSLIKYSFVHSSVRFIACPVVIVVSSLISNSWEVTTDSFPRQKSPAKTLSPSKGRA